MATRQQSTLKIGLQFAGLLILLSIFGCAGRAWKQASQEDTPTAYYQFMRDHKDSEFIDLARERLAYHKLTRSRSVAQFDKFRQQYPDSELTDSLYALLEESFFDIAQAKGTAEAYRGFAEDYASGTYRARAEGNAVYVAANGFGGNAVELARFAEQYPESDFAAEAKRTSIATAARRAGTYDRVGLILDIAASTPEAKRVRQAFMERIGKMTARLGLEVVQIPMRLASSGAAGYPRARIEVSHRQYSVKPEMTDDGFTRPSMVGLTRVLFREEPGGAIISEREFSIRVIDKGHVAGTSVLFSAAAPKFWDDFFIPAARWRNDSAIRPPIALDAPVVDVDGVGDRSVVLYENGSFELLDLADPTEPLTLASYRRGEEYKRWSRIKLLGDRVAIYGEEGLEIVRMSDSGYVAERTWDRGQIGRVLSIAMLGDELVTVGAKGMQLFDLEGGEPRRLMRRVIQGIGTSGDTLVFADGETVYIANLELLSQNRVIAQMKLGRVFGPKNVRVFDSVAIITGQGGALIIDLKGPKGPKAIAKFSTREVGEISDATVVWGRIFLIGARGALLLDRQLSRVEETLDVGPRHRVAIMGRHLVMTNRAGIQVVDVAPWAQQGSPAAAR